jgi:deazaflavin-dependent oxidoreductase (nitroreductase family)
VIRTFNDDVIEEFRAHGGRVGGVLTGTPILLLHHVGARTSTERVTPLAYTPHGRGYLVVASNGGSATHPRWYDNLKVHPATTVEVGSEMLTVRAEELTGPVRAELWPALLAASPSLREFDAQTVRQIPLFLLNPTGKILRPTVHFGSCQSS